jgi:hypothetical protein
MVIDCAKEIIPADEPSLVQSALCPAKRTENEADELSFYLVLENCRLQTVCELQRGLAR